MGEKVTLSVVMMSYNSGKFIRGSLECIKGWVDEIIIMDMFSADDTVEIARKYTDKVFQDKTYGNQRLKDGISKATSDWVLIVATTDRITQPLKEEILVAIKKDVYVGYRIPRKTYILGLYIEERPGPLSLIKRNAQICVGVGHRWVSIKGKVGYLNNLKIHWGFSSIETAIAKINIQSSIDAGKAFAGHPDAFFWKRPVYRANLFNMLYRPIVGFFAVYFLGKMYRYGMHGLLFTMMSAFNNFLEIAKLWELQYKKEHHISGETMD